MGLATASLLLLIAGMSFSTSPALAKRIHLFAGSLGAATSTPANPYPLSTSLGSSSDAEGSSFVAVEDATGDVYVTDTKNFRIEKFTASGEFILMFGREV